ncbi:MAG: polyribonucleotide nucleotidyltransferase [Candidatus Lloydbacteria bacterium CG22_combo_CG10-13_8_21_14_all_47_15]|uniref:Polyribonucleotide nucleotidyltransferase n=1 Tax=Candidatus Lloydbacteria bacterium CG22_combo_CG10-13_8_21_14_all_47_15 TaxID=1974635 RepID=A0A2H0CV73_9BACT|nr:MAG: polyribonucleotide nucleotidyltransferase [Candidatus Lloydbacteria bacterium CG22_combo_CG10-13_8_21_14_all_47_15]
MQKREFSTEIGGKSLTAIFSDLTDQANGSVILKYGETAVLATAVMSSHARDGMDFFPLVVDYEEKFYAAGAILGSRFVRREGRPSDEAILSGRVIDRTIRPFFNHAMRNEVQVVITVLSIDKDDPDILAVNAASLALAVSDIPWDGPVSAVRIGKHSGQDNFSVNPEYDFRHDNDLLLDFIVSGKDGNIVMIEGSAMQAEEETVAQALRAAQVELEEMQAFQQRIVSEIGKEKARVEMKRASDEARALFTERMMPRMSAAVFTGETGGRGINALKDEWREMLKSELPDEPIGPALELFEEGVDAALHTGAVEEGRRPDGRGFDDVRQIFVQAGGISKILHGSGIFYRGGTHIFSALTLGGPGDAQLIDGMEQKQEKRFMHHYNFPPFSSGETGRIGGLNRRMIGHGALAERALKAVIPPKDIFPYTIRLVSESMASNGSTSMGSVCGSTLALMDGGVPIEAPVAGIAIGLMMSEDGGNGYKVLTDIQGPEDHHGDMDFKAAGTKKGVTAIQMDIKVGGIPLSILEEALAKARDARLKILDIMTAEISVPRSDIAPSAPKILTVAIMPDQIGSVIGPGGKVINKIRDETGVESIDIEENGMVFIAGKNGTAEHAARIIKDMTREYRAGERFTGTVVNILEFGAIVKLNEHKDGMVHISELAPFRVSKVEDVVAIGEQLPVVIKEVEGDRIKLSLKDIDPEYATRKGAKPASQDASRPPYGRHDGAGGGFRGPRRNGPLRGR